MSISGAKTISATFAYAFGRPIAAAAAWELSRLVLATPAISKLSGSARSAGIWPRAAQLLPGCNPTMPTLKRCLVIMFSPSACLGLAVMNTRAHLGPPHSLDKHHRADESIRACTMERFVHNANIERYRRDH